MDYKLDYLVDSWLPVDVRLIGVGHRRLLLVERSRRSCQDRSVYPVVFEKKEALAQRTYEGPRHHQSYGSRWMAMEKRTATGHRKFSHPAKSGKVTLSGQLGEDVPTGTLKAIMKQTGVKI